jgi:hypothetical protein
VQTHYFLETHCQELAGASIAVISAGVNLSCCKILIDKQIDENGSLSYWQHLVRHEARFCSLNLSQATQTGISPSTTASYILQFLIMYEIEMKPQFEPANRQMNELYLT